MAGEQLFQTPLDFFHTPVGSLQAPGEAAAGLQVEVQQARAATDHRTVDKSQREVSCCPENRGSGELQTGISFSVLYP